ncbi:MAG TPA: hypothetical protein VJI75_04875 [Candidatus Nanoarchaeia archaeon]|nr:hypothetical protein [Candidatus Nanoarchaeia archaeon]
MVLLKRFKAAPLSSSFFLASILGVLLSLVYWDKITPTWAFTFLLLFGAMFVASLISMTKAPIEDQIELDYVLKKSGKKK